MQRILCCLLVSLLSCSSLSAAPSVQHYRGVVLDAETRLPVGGVQITAMHHPFTLITVPFFLPENDFPVGHATSQQDGSFDLAVAAEQPALNYLAASLAESRLAHAPYCKEHVGAYQGTLKHVTDRCANTVLIQKLYNSSIYEFPPGLTKRSGEPPPRSGH